MKDSRRPCSIHIFDGSVCRVERNTLVVPGEKLATASRCLRRRGSPRLAAACSAAAGGVIPGTTPCPRGAPRGEPLRVAGKRRVLVGGIDCQRHRAEDGHADIIREIRETPRRSRVSGRARLRWPPHVASFPPPQRPRRMKRAVLRLVSGKCARSAKHDLRRAPSRATSAHSARARRRSRRSARRRDRAGQRARRTRRR